MTTVSATEARKRLYALIDEVGQSHEPVQITGKRGNAVLLSEDDWRAIQETPISSHPPMKPWWAAARNLLLADQHPAPARVPGAGGGADREGAALLEPLRVIAPHNRRHFVIGVGLPG